jgi:hypothetical protein
MARLLLEDNTMKLPGRSIGIETSRELLGAAEGRATEEILSDGNYPFDLAGAGGALRSVREKKGVDLAFIAETLLVKKSTIRAIETGTWGNLPHSIYVKGYVRSYARYMDVQDQVEPFLFASQPSHCAPVDRGEDGAGDDAGSLDDAITPIRSLWCRAVAICQLSALRNALLSCSSLLGLALASLILS